jgi:hypothetical protein
VIILVIRRGNTSGFDDEFRHVGENGSNPHLKGEKEVKDVDSKTFPVWKGSIVPGGAGSMVFNN